MKNSMRKDFINCFDKLYEVEKAKESYSVNTLYHYTTIEALKNIIETNTFWITKWDYLNDKSEMEYAERLIISVLEDEEFGDEFKLQVKNILATAKELLDNSYILSLTDNEDSLTLWSNYNRFEGYNFGIDMQEFTYLLNQGEAEIILNESIKLSVSDTITDRNDYQLLKVIYDYDKQINIIKDIVNSIHDFFKKYSSIDIPSDKAFMNYTQVLIYSLFDLLVSFKDPCFKAEEEYRVVFRFDNKDITDKTVNYRISNGAFIPFIKIKLNKIPFESMKIGPRNNADIALKGLYSFLISNKYTEIIASKSKIPLR